MEETELLVAEDYNFENWAKWKNEDFLEISECRNCDARNRNRQFSHRKVLYD